MMPLNAVKTMIHNLNNKLTAALGFVDLAQHEGESNRNKRQEYLSKAYRELREGIGILAELLKQEIFKSR